MRLNVTPEPAAVFWFDCTYDERAIPKGAGFWWHVDPCQPSRARPCAACAAGLGKVWWTPSQETALGLSNHASPEASKALGLPPVVVKSSKPVCIGDKNLRLALLEALVARALVARPTRARGLESRYHRDVFQQLDALQPTRDQLAQLEAVNWHAQLECIDQIFPQWPGEDNAFEISQLAGIEVCEGLCVLELSLFVGTDLTPLAQLPKLETLELSGGNLAGGDTRIADLSPLTALTSLRSVTLDAIVANAANRAVIAKLCAQGTHWRIGNRRFAPGGAPPGTRRALGPQGAPDPGAKTDPASVASLASLEALRALEREGVRLVGKGAFEPAVDVYARALTMREVLADRGELAAGASRSRPETRRQPGDIPFASEANVLAGVALVAHAHACAHQDKERFAHLLRAGTMLAEAGRHDDEVLAFLSHESSHASDSGLDDEAVQLATLALACAQSAGVRVQEAEAILADVRARRNLRAARGEAVKVARASLDGLRVLELDARKLERAGMHAKRVTICKKALVLRRDLAARGELAAGAGGPHIPRQAGWSPAFVAESNVLAGLSLLASALRAAGKEAAALPYTLEACEALVAASRSQPDALAFLLAGARDARAAQEPAVAQRLARVARERATAVGAPAILEAIDALLADVGPSE